MSGCDSKRVQGTACNCCSGTEIQQRLKAIIRQQQDLQTTLDQLQRQYDRLPPIPSLSGCTGRPIANNARIAQCADIDRIENDLDNLRSSLRYELSDCSGVTLAAGSRVASCDDLSAVTAEIDRLVSQYTHLQQEVNRVREIAEAAKQTVDAITLTSNIDTSTLQGILDRMKGLEERVSSVAATADAASAGVDILNAKPKD